jgi:predicted phage terminase large subunit-like protein
MYNEVNADKGMVARDLKKLGVKVVTYSETTNKYIKIVTYLKKVWKDIIFVNGTDPEYIEQITDYTDVAEHDDAPDSLASLIREMYPKLGRDENISLYDL